MEHHRMNSSSYSKFALTLILSFIIMYLVMFLNVSSASDILMSVNRFYMAVLMTASMALLMSVMMGSMYPNRSINKAIRGGAVCIFLVAFMGLRNQVLVDDKEYLKGMIPHHSSAILTSSKANITDPEVRKLADGIIASQEREIAEMKQLLNKLQNRY